MIFIYKKAEVTSRQSAYTLANNRTNKAIETLLDEDGLELLMDILPCTKTDVKPRGFQMMPKSYEEEFFINA